MAVPITTGVNLVDVVSKALHLDPNYTSRIIIDMSCWEVTKVYVQMVGSEKLMSIDWENAFADAKVIKIDD